jgi:hypothetical protein
MLSPRLILAPLVAAATLLALHPALQAQTTGTGTGSGAGSGSGSGSTSTNTTAGPLAVFRMTFSQTGDSINYRPYQGGYYVTPLEGGTGSILLTLVTGNTKQYFTYQSFGDSFVAVKGSTKKMVFSATAASDVSTTVFYAIGTTDTDVNTDFRNGTADLLVASKMTGYAVSADSEKDLPFSGTGTSVGVAGVSILTCKYDESTTRTANNAGNTVGDAITAIIAQLTKSGYTDGLAASTGNSAGGTTSTPASSSTNSTSTSGTSSTSTTSSTSGTTTGG